MLDIEDDASEERSVLILGQPFFMTAKTKIDVHARTLSMEFGDTYVEINIFEALKHPTEDHSTFSMDTIDRLKEDSCPRQSYKHQIGTLKYLLKKPDAKPRLIRWMMLLQEFNIEIRDKKGAKNLEREIEPIPIQDEFPDEQILRVTHATPWYANIFNYLVASSYPIEASKAIKERLESNAKCIPESKIKSIVHFYHSMIEEGHYGSMRTAQNVLDCRLYRPTIFRDMHRFVSAYE
ncbi:hypothetical protein CR513_10892, partial [Mucuna pruriens]